MSRPLSFAFATLLAVAAPLIGSQAAAQPAPPAIAPLPPAQTSATVAKVEAFYHAVASFKGSFQQQFHVKSHNLRKDSAGTVTFAKPGKMSWHYTNPPGNRVVSDGRILQVYDAAQRQLFQQPVSTSQIPAPLSFLTGTGRLTGSFTFEMYPGSAMSFPGGVVLVGTPIQPAGPYTKVLFYVDAATSQIGRVLMIDAQGNRNRFDFIDPQINVAVPPATFTFTPPAGTTIIAGAPPPPAPPAPSVAPATPPTP